MTIKYLLGALISIPLLPFMYFQGKRIRASVPKLAEARGTEGHCRLNKDYNNDSLKLIAIGESTIAGVGVETHKEGFTGTFANEISRLFNVDVKWKVYARSGYTAKMVDKELIPTITENHTDLVIIGLGANDAFTLNRPSKWKTDIRLLINSIRSKFPETIIVFCNMPPIKEFPALTAIIKFVLGNLVEILGSELQKTVKEYENVFYFGEKITLSKWIEKFELKAKKEDFFSDGIHPSKLTYQTWAKDVASKVSKNEKIKAQLT